MTCPTSPWQHWQRRSFAPQSRRYLAEASIDPQATLASEVTVAPLARIDRGATVGSGTVIHSQAFIGRDAIIGENVEIHPGAKVLERCRLGDGVILQAGAVIGSDGFGYAPDNEGTAQDSADWYRRLGRPC